MEQVQPQPKHTGLIIVLIIIIIICVGVVLYLLNLLPQQVADLVIKPTTQVTTRTTQLVDSTARSIADLGSVKSGWPDEPFSPPMANTVWRVEGDELFGIEFDKNGLPQYMIHGVKGAYMYDDVPLDGEHVYWLGTSQKTNDYNDIDPGVVSGYWMRFTAVRDIDQSWGKILAGQVDYTYKQTSGHGLTQLNKSSIKKTNTNSSQ